MWIFGSAALLGAFLLFGVELLMGKYAAPMFGGGAAVWTACLLFFQAGLLVGYGYAHVLLTKLAPRRQAQVHAAVLGAAFMLLLYRAHALGSPLAPAPVTAWASNSLTIDVLKMLAATVGLPFVALAATAPLVQGWFRNHSPSGSPYRLYALSNVGSVTSLLAYPTLIEPFVTRRVQAWAFAAVFLAFAAICIGACVRAMRAGTAEAAQEAPAAAEPVRLWKIAAWIGLSGVGSLFLCATTGQVSQDVAGGPFIWMVPLALYLTTFILCFEHSRFYKRPIFTALFGLSTLCLAMVLTMGARMNIFLTVAVAGITLFAGCMVLHGELYRLRPDARALSTFYVCVSIGGVLGGIFAGLVAPRIFSKLLEFPLSLGFTCVVAVVAVLREPRERDWGRFGGTASAVGAGLLMLFTWIAAGQEPPHRGTLRYQVRNTLGVLRVFEDQPEDVERHNFYLLNGAITHGSQFLSGTYRGQATSYYGVDTGLGQAIAQQRALHAERGLRIGALGLGVGTVAVYGKAKDSIRFYEINPLVTALARGEGGFFHYLQDTPAKVEVFEGDARQTLERELATSAPETFDILAVDCFSGDSIPVHLLTEEAVRLYLRRISMDGVLALHVSNRHLDLAAVAEAIADRIGLSWVDVATTRATVFASTTEWIVMAGPGRKLDPHAFERAGVVVQERRPSTVWTDESNALLPALIASSRED